MNLADQQTLITRAIAVLDQGGDVPDVAPAWQPMARQGLADSMRGALADHGEGDCYADHGECFAIANARRILTHNQPAPTGPVCRCGHELNSHDADAWTKGQPVNRRCLIPSCGCGWDKTGVVA
ncbi:MAG: hypothetical protein M3N43_06920 [Actinomycetota bacterium]|nr:hypothetical protein [Actinomycetota bacterium]